MTDTFNGADPAPYVPPSPLTGDTTDDDGRAIDEFFEAMDAGPLVFGGSVVDAPEPKVTTRILGRRFNLISPFEPQQILPADPNRIAVRIQYKSTLGAALAFASEKSDVYSAPVFHVPFPAGLLAITPILEIPHTGALWVWFPGADVDINFDISVWAITS